MIQFLKRIVERLLGVKIYRTTLPRGTDLAHDLTMSYGLDRFRCIFDVGANVGQTALKFSTIFPSADLLCFEPVGSTFEMLKHNVSHLPHVRTFPYALGASEGTVEMNISPDSKTSSLRTRRPEDHSDMVQVRTLDRFCADSGVTHIHLLKIDVEGFELEVLEGASGMLNAQSIDMVLLEASPGMESHYFVTYAQLMTKMTHHGYELYGVYEQQPFWNGRQSVLYFNLLFASSRLLDQKN